MDDRMDTQAREHAAWLDIGQEFANRGVDINTNDWTQLILAIRKWGEELHQLRLAAPEYDDGALRDARDAYPEGQYERGTYPQTIERHDEERLEQLDRTIRLIVEQDVPWSADEREVLIGHLTGAIFVIGGRAERADG